MDAVILGYKNNGDTLVIYDRTPGAKVIIGEYPTNVAFKALDSGRLKIRNKLMVIDVQHYLNKIFSKSLPNLELEEHKQLLFCIDIEHRGLYSFDITYVDMIGNEYTEDLEKFIESNKHNRLTNISIESFNEKDIKENYIAVGNKIYSLYYLRYLNPKEASAIEFAINTDNCYSDTIKSKIKLLGENNKALQEIANRDIFIKELYNIYKNLIKQVDNQCELDTKRFSKCGAKLIIGPHNSKIVSKNEFNSVCNLITSCTPNLIDKICQSDIDTTRLESFDYSDFWNINIANGIYKLLSLDGTDFTNIYLAKDNRVVFATRIRNIKYCIDMYTESFEEAIIKYIVTEEVNKISLYNILNVGDNIEYIGTDYSFRLNDIDATTEISKMIQQQIKDQIMILHTTHFGNLARIHFSTSKVDNSLFVFLIHFTGELKGSTFLSKRTLLAKYRYGEWPEKYIKLIRGTP